MTSAGPLPYSIASVGRREERFRHLDVDQLLQINDELERINVADCLVMIKLPILLK
jgi:hypothetical protein